MNDYSAVLFAVVAMVFWGVEEFLLKEAISKLKSLTTLFLNTITSVLASTLIVLLIFNEKISLISGSDFLFTIFVTGITFIGFIYLYYALERQKLSIIASLDESWIIISILIGVVFMGEVLEWVHIAAIIAVLLGAFLISIDFGKLKGIKLVSGTGYELLSILFVGVALPLQKFLIHRIGESNTVVYINSLILLMIFVWKYITREKFIAYDKKHYRIALLSGLTDGVAFAASIIAIKSAKIYVISPILASSVIVSVILAKVYLKERLRKKEIVGGLLILIAVLFLSSFFEA